MADNTVLNAGSGGDTFATDDIGGIKFPRSKIVIGADGTNDGDVSAANPLPISDASGSLTVDAPVGTPVFVRLSDGSAAITTLAVSLASVPSHAVTNAGTFAVQVDGSALTALQLIDDVVLAEDAAHASGDKGVMGLSVRRDTAAATAGTDGDYQPLTTDSTGRLWCNVSNTVTVSGTVAATQSGTWNVGTVTTVSTVTTVTTVTTCGTVTTLTGSGVAHDGVDSGNPHKIGAKAIASLSGATMVAAADRTDLYAGVDGVLITRPHSNLEDLVSGTADITDGSSTSVIAAAGAGVKIYVSDIIISNSSATAVTVTIRDGAAGTVKATIMVPAGAPVHKTLQCPIAFSANTAVCADPSASASTVSVTLSGFKSKV